MDDQIKKLRSLIAQKAFSTVLALTEKNGTAEPSIMDIRAIALASSGKVDEAYQLQKQALALAKHRTPFFQNLATYASYLNLHQEAYVAWLHLYENGFKTENTLFNLSLSEFHLADYANCTAHLKEYLLEYPNTQKAVRLLANTLTQTGALDKAAELLNEFVQVHPSSIDELFQLALIQRDLDQLSNSKACLLKVLALDKFHVEAHFELAQIYLREQTYSEGFQEFEWRLKRSNAADWRFFPELEKGEDLTDKKLLVYCEQGAGDALHFIRYIPALTTLNIDYQIICQPSLVRLFSTMGLNVQDHSDPPPQCDRQCPIMSLPYRLSLSPTMDIADNIKTLFPTPAKSDKLRVGICWSGSQEFANNHLRSCGITVLTDLFQIPNIEWTLLMPDLEADDAEHLPHDIMLKLPLNYKSDYLETACIISMLDLVITVDTSVAHLAGLLGKKTKILLHTPPDWRWFNDQKHSTLYPSLSIYRQPTPNDWHTPISRLVNDLKLLTAS